MNGIINVDAKSLGVDRFIRSLERGWTTQSEFFNSMVEALAYLPAGEKQPILRALAVHGSERVREGGLRVQKYLRNQELSRDFEHIQRCSPLRPGMCLELSVGNLYPSNNRPAWLSGRESSKATFIRFERLGDNLAPVALVEFDETIDLPGHHGRYGVLFAWYGEDNPVWALLEGAVAMCVVEALPNHFEDFCDSHPFTERHVCYRVKATLDQASEANG